MRVTERTVTRGELAVGASREGSMERRELSSVESEWVMMEMRMEGKARWLSETRRAARCSGETSAWRMCEKTVRRLSVGKVWRLVMRALRFSSVVMHSKRDARSEMEKEETRSEARAKERNWCRKSTTFTLGMELMRVQIW